VCDWSLCDNDDIHEPASKKYPEGRGKMKYAFLQKSQYKNDLALMKSLSIDGCIVYDKEHSWPLGKLDRGLRGLHLLARARGYL